MADRLVEDGFAKAGYRVVGIDDCWLARKRDLKGRLQPDKERFPSGISKLADYLHERQELPFPVFPTVLEAYMQ